MSTGRVTTNGGGIVTIENYYQSLLDQRPSDHTNRHRLSQSLDAVGDVRGLGYFLLALHKRYPSKTARNTWVWMCKGKRPAQPHMHEALPPEIFDRLSNANNLTGIAEYATRKQAEDEAGRVFAEWMQEETPNGKTAEGNRT